MIVPTDSLWYELGKRLIKRVCKVGQIQPELRPGEIYSLWRILSTFQFVSVCFCRDWIKQLSLASEPPPNVQCKRRNHVICGEFHRRLQLSGNPRTCQAKDSVPRCGNHSIGQTLTRPSLIKTATFDSQRDKNSHYIDTDFGRAPPHTVLDH